MLGDRLFMATLDAHLLALDMRTGTVVWDAVIADYKLGYAATVAPLVVKDKVIVGISGGDFPTRGFIDAYDAATGKRSGASTRSPAPGEPGSETWPKTRRDRPRRRRRVGDRQLRSRAEPALLRHRQSRTRTTTATIARATTSTPRRSSRSTPTPAS